MSNPREGSRKRQVYDLLQSEGAEAAVTLGETLGLKESTVRSWLKQWGSDKRSIPHRRRARVPIGNYRRVVASYDRKMAGSVVEEGPQVSGVRWDDNESRAVSYVPNQYLIDKP